MGIFANGVKMVELTEEQKRAFLKVKALKEKHVPTVSNNYVWAHGLNAVNRSQSPAVALEKLLKILGTGAEISAAKSGPENNEFNGGLGKIGVYVKGQTSLICKVDCGSTVVDGKRYPSLIADKYFVNTPEEIGDQREYSEAFVAPEQIVGFWVSAKAYKNYLTDFESGVAAEKYKKSFGDHWERLYDFEYLKPREGFINCLNMLKDMGIPMSFAW